MLLTPDQAQAIRQRVCSHMGALTRIWLFGSSLDDGRLGGDVGAAFCKRFSEFQKHLGKSMRVLAISCLFH